VHNISFDFLFLFFLPEADQLLVILLVQLLHQELRVETVFVLTVYEVLHNLLLFSLIWSIVGGRGDYDSLRHFPFCPDSYGQFGILLTNL
jgi:hypothetical protein